MNPTEPTPTVRETIAQILQPMHDNGQDGLALCSYETGRWPQPHTCGLPEAVDAILAAIDKDVIGDDLHVNGINCPKWLKPKEGESWEGAIRYEQGYNAAKAEQRTKLYEEAKNG